jgi:peptidoglycan/LPS O-acetylase OafA/YrhL
MRESLRSTPLDHLPQLDGLRCLAVTLVVLEHSGCSLAEQHIELGYAGVWLFFVLSGFLITSILLRMRDEGGDCRHSLRAFYARRFLRIFPLYYGVLLACLAFGLPAIRQDGGWYFSYLANWKLAADGDFGSADGVGHFWSLGVEEQFYCVWPFLILFVPSRRLLVVVACIAGLGPISRALVASLGGTEMTAQIVTPSCLDALGAGALLAILRRSPAAAQLPQYLRVSLCAGIGLYAFNLAVQWQGHTGPFTTAAHGVALALIGVWLVGRAADGFRGPLGAVLNARHVRHVGIVSYGVYVYHGILVWLLLNWRICAPGILCFLLCWLLTVLVASISWQLFEAPINEMKKYFPYPAGERQKPEPATAPIPTVALPMPIERVIGGSRMSASGP